MFSHPNILWLLLILPALSILWAYVWWARRRAQAKLGNRFRIERLSRVRRGWRWLGQTCLSFGVAALILGLAGPQWGRERVETRPPHQDLVVVLDVSRSMLAEQPSRLERGLRALEDLNKTLRPRGEVRLGLVLGAAYPRLQLPPSQDYDHFALLLERVRLEDLPPELWQRPQVKPVSGTRLGAALAQAVKLYQPKQTRAFDILLVSDGHDPVDDDEWLQGVLAAREAKIPIHVLAVGDPEAAPAVPGTTAKSRLNEARLQEIAQRTGGVYLPEHNLPQATHDGKPRVPLGAHLREVLYERGISESMRSDEAPELYQPQKQHAWFFLAGLGLFSLALLIREGRAFPKAPPAVPRLLLVPLALFLVSAAPPAEVEDWIRQANDAFAREQYQEAVDLYAKAEGKTLDPGLVAFNKGTALHHLGQYAEAAAHFQRCVEDTAAAKERLQKGHYDLGVSLLAQSRGLEADVLRRAVSAFRSCLDLTPSDPNLRDDARFNLELAQRLWLAAVPKVEKDKAKDGSDTTPKDGKAEDKGKPELKKQDKTGEKGPDKGKHAEDKKIEGSDKIELKGERSVIFDQKELEKLSPQQMQQLLQEQVERISRERLLERRGAAGKLSDAPNW